MTQRASLLAPLALLACNGIATSPVTHRGDGCDQTMVDLWRIHDAPPGLLSARLDTVDAETTFDPDVFLYHTSSWEEGPNGVTATRLIAYSDDRLACAFPPADFPACPLAVGRTDESFDEDLLLLVGNRGACAGERTGYELNVDVEGVPVGLSFHGTGSVDPYVADE